ncbi:MAG: xylulokinase, partial [Candidatus Enteromonas sp.]
KMLLVSLAGDILNETSREYPVFYPRPGWSEQDPAAWWDAVLDGLQELLQNADKESVRAISFGGQMHGLVALDEADRVIRPCILWNDGRTEEETEFLNREFGKQKLSECVGNIAFAGFTAPKLLWLKKHEPGNFARIAKIMLPKDYLVYRFSGSFVTDYSDASGTLLLDVKNKRWSKEMVSFCDVPSSALPRLLESYEIAGTIQEDVAKILGLPTSVRIVAGAGDNAAAAVGTAAVQEGTCNISLGTSGTIFIPGDSFFVPKDNALHSFAHANGKWHLMGCILSAASCRFWWLEDILEDPDYEKDEKLIEEANADGLYFLPYLSGERSPHNDVHARGAFLGLSKETTRGAMSKAILEGVGFALRDCLEVARKNGISPKSATLCGGGAKSGIWSQILADILNIPVFISENKQGVSYGAAILAMVGDKAYPTVKDACAALGQEGRWIEPVKESAERYEKKYETFVRLYPALKEAFAK